MLRKDESFLAGSKGSVLRLTSSTLNQWRFQVDYWTSDANILDAKTQNMKPETLRPKGTA